MRSMDDAQLLSTYVTQHSEEAFATLVERHISLVYSAALRQVRDAHMAEEITQAVFILLAQKARSLRRESVLAGWLCRTAHFASCNALKAERRRQLREQEAYMNSLLNDPDPELWTQIMPLLDEAVAQLNKADRDALVMRFYQQKSLMEVGLALGLSEDSAQKRVSRALQKLHKFFVKRGVTVSVAAIASTVMANSVHAAPAGLATTVTAAAATGAGVGGSTLTIIKGVLKIMAWTKAKMAVAVGVGVLLAAGTTTITVKQIQEHRSYPWQTNEGFINDIQRKQPPQVRILNSKFQKPAAYLGNDMMLGTGNRAKDIVSIAYGFAAPARVTFHAKLPTNNFDFIACLPGGETVNLKALQDEAKSKFGVIGKKETREMEVMLLKVKVPNATALEKNVSGNGGNGFFPNAGGFRGWNEPMFAFAMSLEYLVDFPIIDETGLTDRYDFDLNITKTDFSNRDWNVINEVLSKIGLELIPTNRHLETLVVEKAK